MVPVISDNCSIFIQFLPNLLSPAAMSLTDFFSNTAPGVIPTILPPPPTDKGTKSGSLKKEQKINWKNR